jgi:hypothetical protein
MRFTVWAILLCLAFLTLVDVSATRRLELPTLQPDSSENDIKTSRPLIGILSQVRCHNALLDHLLLFETAGRSHSCTSLFAVPVSTLLLDLQNPSLHAHHSPVSPPPTATPTSRPAM